MFLLMQKINSRFSNFNGFVILVVISFERFHQPYINLVKYCLDLLFDVCDRILKYPKFKLRITSALIEVINFRQSILEIELIVLRTVRFTSTVDGG